MYVVYISIYMEYIQIYNIYIYAYIYIYICSIHIQYIFIYVHIHGLELTKKLEASPQLVEVDCHCDDCKLSTIQKNFIDMALEIA